MLNQKKNKSTELRAISLFKELSIKGWRRYYRIKGRPDFVFLKIKLAIFIDGCYWHGCKLHCRLPQTNRKYWSNKIDRNIKHDRSITSYLLVLGWKVIRIWEHELRNPVSFRKLNRIKKELL